MIGDRNFIDELCKRLVTKQSKYLANSNLKLHAKIGGQTSGVSNRIESYGRAYTAHQVQLQQQQQHQYQYQTQEVTVIGADQTNNNDTFDDTNSTIDNRACSKPAKKVIRNMLYWTGYHFTAKDDMLNNE